MSLSLLAGLFSGIASIIYIHGILTNDIQPVKASSVLGTICTISIFIDMWHHDAVNGQILMSAERVCITMPLTVRFGRPGWEPVDILFFTFGLGGIFVWSFVGDPNWRIAIGLLTLAIGSIPTWVWRWKVPRHENRTSLVFGMAASTCAIVGIPQLAFAHAAQPIVFLMLQSIMGYLVWVRPYHLQKKQSPP